MLEKKYLSLREVAELLDVKTGTVRKWVRQGCFPKADARLNRKSVLWKAESVEMFIESQRGGV